jgi:polyhydroxyalkanoate synthesis regulator phasin
MSSSSADASPGRSKSFVARTARAAGMPQGIAAAVEQFVNRVLKPFDMVLLSRERIQETLDEAAERGRVTRSDANALVLELIQRGRQQTDDLLGQLESLLGRGADGATRGQDEDTLPIDDYDELTARQVIERLHDLKGAQLRAVRDYERRHANRKSVLQAAERARARGE